MYRDRGEEQEVNVKEGKTSIKEGLLRTWDAGSEDRGRRVQKKKEK